MVYARVLEIFDIVGPIKCYLILQLKFKHKFTIISTDIIISMYKYYN